MPNRDGKRIFALSDTHLAPWPPVPADTDVVLFGGDFYDGAVLAGCGDDDDANRFLFSDAILQAQRQAPPIVAVRGNHDYADPFSFFAGSRDVTAKAALAMPGLIVVGVGLAHREHLRLPTETEMEKACASSLASFRQIRKHHADALVILLSHYPGTSMVRPDESATLGWAFDCVDRLADAVAPRIAICGHVHEAFGREVDRAGVVMPGPQGCVLSVG